MSVKSAIVIPDGAVNVSLAVAPSATRAPPPTRRPIGSLPWQAVSAEIPPAPAAVHEWLPYGPHA